MTEVSSDQSGQESNERRGGQEPAREQVSEPWLSEFKSFVEEYKRNNAEAERAQATKAGWEKGTALSLWVYTLVTMSIAFVSYQQLSLSGEQERAQLRPYVVIKAAIPEFTEGSRMEMALDLENVGNTPVYGGKLYPIYNIEVDRKLQDTPHICDPTDQSDGPGQTFGKTTSYKPIKDPVISKATFDLVAGGATDFAFFARYCYSDIFKENNWNNVCFYWHADAGKVEGKYCDSYNDAISDFRPTVPRGFLCWLLAIWCR